MNSSYIILPNGSFDPWHALGKLASSDPTIVPVVIQGTSHCAGSSDTRKYHKIEKIYNGKIPIFSLLHWHKHRCRFQKINWNFEITLLSPYNYLIELRHFQISDMYGPGPNDSADLTAGRAKISSTLLGWLGVNQH